MELDLEEAYAEACRIIGEQAVVRRILARSTQPAPAPAEQAPTEERTAADAASAE